MSQKLFPPFLDPGSYGGAVDKLHLILDGFGFGDGIVPDLQYGQITTVRVAELQRWLEIVVDGKFGPTTREALKAKTGFDVDRINWAPQDGVTVWFDAEGTNRGAWPEWKL